MGADGSAPAELAALGEGNLAEVAWSPDGRRLLVGSRERLRSVDVEDGTVDVAAPGGVTAVGWSPDGQRMYALAEGSNGGFELSRAGEDDDDRAGAPDARSVGGWSISIGGCPRFP